MTTGCLTAEALARFLSDPTTSDRAVVEAHIDQCAECAATLAAAAANPDDDDRGPERATADRLGRYQLGELLGAGGMGEVFAAYDPTLERRVAIKLVGAQLHHRDAGARLVREARAAARLTHHNVVRIYDVGQLEDGELFIAMELIDGRTLRAWWGEQRRSWRQVVRTLVRAGQGLSAAHDVGLVHRDFTPANVLVAHSGRVCVTDFGIARAFAEPATAAQESRSSIVTSAAGTPRYMAPEAVCGAPITAASDQYAFGVTLQEALESCRSVPPRWLRKLVARAQHIDPAQRFVSMQELLGQLTSGLQRRRRLAMAAAVVALCGASIAIAVPLRSAPQSCSDAGASWRPIAQRATQAIDAVRTIEHPLAAPTADQLRLLLEDYGAAWQAQRIEVCRSTPRASQPGLSLRDRQVGCLERLAAQADALVRSADDATAEELPNLVPAAQALAPLHWCDAAEVLASDALEPPDPQARQAVARIRATLATARTARELGRFQVAQEQLAPLLPEVVALDVPAVEAELHYELGLLHNENKQRPQAKQELETAIWQAEASGHLQLLIDATTRSITLCEPTEAGLATGARWARHARAALQRAGVSFEIYEVRIELGLALLHHAAGQPDVALDHLQAAEALGGDLPPRERGSVANNTGRAHNKLGNHQQAAEAYRRAAAIYRAEYGDEHPLTITALSNLATVYTTVGETDQAIAAHQQVLERRRRLWGKDHRSVAVSWTNLAVAQSRAGHRPDAIASYRKAIAILERTDPGGSAVTVTRANLSSVLADSGELEKATALATRALADARALYDSDHPRVAFGLLNRGTIYQLAGQLPAAHADLTEALEIFGGRLGPEHYLVGHTSAALGEVELQLGHRRAARALLETALPLLTTAGRDDQFRGMAEFALARLHGRHSRRGPALGRAAAEHFSAAHDDRGTHAVAAWLQPEAKPTNHRDQNNR